MKKIKNFQKKCKILGCSWYWYIEDCEKEVVILSKKEEADRLFKEAYKAYYTDVYRFALSYLLKDKDSVEDVVQETFLVLYNKYRKGEEIEHIKAFLFKTANNYIKKKLREISRNSKNVSIDEITEIPSQSEDLDERLTFEEYSNQISEALSVRDAELFRLRYIENYSLEEIAASLKISVSAAGTRVYRLRNRLIKIIEDIFEK